MTDGPPPLRHDLPLSEPDGSDLQARRQDLLHNIEELMSIFQYMGTGHPEHQATKMRLEQMRTMLAQLDMALASQTSKT